MKATQILRKAMAEKKVTQGQLAEEFNTSRQCISAKLNYSRQQMKADDFLNYMKFVGYTAKFVDESGNILQFEDKVKKTNFDVCCESIEALAQIIDVAKCGWTKEKIVEWLKSPAEDNQFPL